jgi:hypothetical protein
MKKRYCSCCQEDTLSIEEKGTHGCTGVLMLMLLVPSVSIFVSVSHDPITGMGAGVAAFFGASVLMMAKKYRCGFCGYRT